MTWRIEIYHFTSTAVPCIIAYLLKNQKKDGSWDEAFYTGTGFPRVFYLKYHLYRQYFPLIALTTYAKVMAEKN